MKDKVFALQNLKEQITKQALSKLESGILKDAVDHYKKLMVDPEVIEYRKQQVNGYLRKAQDLTIKEVFNDVQNLWNEHLGNEQQKKDIEQIFINLIQSQSQDEIHQQLKTLTVEQIDQQYPLFSMALGALMLTGKSELEQYLPVESAFIAHFKSAQEALTRFHVDSPEAIRKIIKKIPYHSAFRDFRILINAALAMPFLTGNEVRLLNKISCHSAYFQAAKALLAIAQGETDFTQNLMFFNSRLTNIIAEIKGLNKQQRQFVEELAKLRQPLSAKEKFNLAIRFQALLKKQLAQQFCLAILREYPEGIQEIKENFFANNEFEQNRVQALLAEQDKKLDDAEFFWRQCIRNLKDNNTDSRLKIALILRHLANILPESERAECLMESLQYDADDRASVEQILKHFCQKQHLDENQLSFMEQAVKQFPEDIEILIHAIQISINIDNKEKAQQYAEKTLAIDPLNSFAKQVVVNGYIEQIRSFLQNKEFQRANKTIQQVKAIQLGKAEMVQIQLLEAFLYFVEQDKQLGLEKIAHAFVCRQYDPVNAHFQAAMEAQLAGLPVATILKSLPPVTNHSLSSQSFEQLIKTISHYHKDEGYRRQLYKSLEKIKSSLKQSLQQVNYDENLLLAFCKLLAGIQHYQLLRYCSKLALKDHQKPVWGFYSVVAETENNPERCNIQQYLALKSDLANARLQQDYRTVLELEHYLDQYLKIHPQQNLDMIEDAMKVNEANFQENDGGAMEQLFGKIPDREFSLLNKEMDKLAKKLSPEQLVGQVFPQHEQNTILAALMNEPDLYTAMLVLKAADKMDIEINVTLKDVLDCFGIDKK